MDNENKELQNDINMDELEEKVRQDVSSKIAEAAAEIQDEIDEAAAEVEVEFEIEETEEVVTDAEDASWDDENYVEPEVVVEPKMITMKLQNLIMSLVGTAVAGALILLLFLQIPTWVEKMPEGKTVAKVGGVEITDMDMDYYVLKAAYDYLEENGGMIKEPAEYNWSTETADGKTAAEVVKEMALENAINDAVLLSVGKEKGVKIDEEEIRVSAKSQLKQMMTQFGEDLSDLYLKMQGVDTEKQYLRKVVQMQYLTAVEEDMVANPDNYYPKDMSVLNDYVRTDKATVKHILIAATPEGEEPEEGALTKEEARAKAEEVLARVNNGEDFDTLVAEFNEDPGQTEDGYTFGPGEMVKEFEDAAFALKLDEVSGLVETTYGYHIIKRLVGQGEQEAYLRDEMKVKVKNGAVKKISVADIITENAEAGEKFQAGYAEKQGVAK